MIHINGKADPNDIAKVLKKHKEEDIISVQPCPYTDYDHKAKTGKINPHLTRFMLKDGTYVGIFHIKPIYYETLEGNWRPMEEVTIYHGNKRLDFKGDWHEKMHPRYMDWLIKRAELLKAKDKISVATPSYVTVEGEEVTVT
jgi:hypothetical protein